MVVGDRAIQRDVDVAVLGDSVRSRARQGAHPGGGLGLAGHLAEPVRELQQLVERGGAALGPLAVHGEQVQAVLAGPVGHTDTVRDTENGASGWSITASPTSVPPVLPEAWPVLLPSRSELEMLLRVYIFSPPFGSSPRGRGRPPCRGNEQLVLVPAGLQRPGLPAVRQLRQPHGQPAQQRQDLDLSSVPPSARASADSRWAGGPDRSLHPYPAPPPAVLQAARGLPLGDRGRGGRGGRGGRQVVRVVNRRRVARQHGVYFCLGDQQSDLAGVTTLGARPRAALALAAAQEDGVSTAVRTTYMSLVLVSDRYNPSVRPRAADFRRPQMAPSTPEAFGARRRCATPAGRAAGATRPSRRPGSARPGFPA